MDLGHEPISGRRSALEVVSDLRGVRQFSSAQPLPRLLAALARHAKVLCQEPWWIFPRRNCSIDALDLPSKEID